MEERTLREQLEDRIANEIESLYSMELGTDEHSKASDDIAKLYRVYVEDYKVECEAYNQNQKIENDKERDKKELEIKQLQTTIEENKHKRVKLDTIITCGTVVCLTVGTCMFESKGHILPTKLLKYVDKIRLPL